MEYADWIPERVAQLRMGRGVSARDMSLSLGQSESYINKIENHRALPSMMGFLYIYEYLGVTPGEFFDAESAAPEKVGAIAQAARRLTPRQADHVLEIIRDITE